MVRQQLEREQLVGLELERQQLVKRRMDGRQLGLVPRAETSPPLVEWSRRATANGARLAKRLRALDLTIALSGLVQRLRSLGLTELGRDQPEHKHIVF